MEVNKGLNTMYLTTKPIKLGLKMCECCDQHYFESDGNCETLRGIRGETIGVCSNYCLIEVEEDIRIGDMETRENYYLYGNDYDR